MGDQVLKGVRTLETRKEKVSFFGLRPLEGLLTPESRKEVLYVFSDNEISPSKLERAIRIARHRMWCKFIWERHPNISDEHRMLLLYINVFIFLDSGKLHLHCNKTFNLKTRVYNIFHLLFSSRKSHS